jgi:hypothetical protein
MFKDLAVMSFGGLVSALNAVLSVINSIASRIGPVITGLRTLTSFTGSASAGIPTGGFSGASVHESASFIPRSNPTGSPGTPPATDETPITEAGMRRVLERTISPVVVLDRMPG